MSKLQKYVVSLAILLVLLTSIEIQTCKAQPTPDGGYFPLVGPLTIVSPTNNTYRQAPTVLSIDFRTMPGPIYEYKMYYSLDGEANTTIQASCRYDPLIEKLRTPHGIVTRGPFPMAPNYRVTATATLPALPEGYHNLTVYATYNRINDQNLNWPLLLLDEQTVNFTVNYGVPPTLTSFSVGNKTYREQSLPLSFSTDKPTSWMGYCLDGSLNETITGNTTLPELATGVHNLTIYAKDMMGNVGSSGTVAFNITIPEKPLQGEANPVGIVALVIVAVFIVAGLLLVVRKKRVGLLRVFSFSLVLA